ncbi:Fructokinase [Kluyvera cryocrescens]|uniref:Fructokinase n=1 Tax=Kluyvera cryocrescens TaxID=580 RepID=A0A485D2F2_KLUCR|nr:Fructokinase [Kluyvera cryocrescens]
MRIGIDLGGTKTEVIALGDQGEQLYRHRLPTPRDYRQTIENIAHLVALAEEATGKIGTVGIGIPWLDFTLYRGRQKPLIRPGLTANRLIKI